MNRWILAAALCLSAPVAHAQSAQDFAAAVAASDRPADQIALDASRRPAEVLAFLGLKHGMVAADIMAGGGYYSEIMSRVVGPTGKVLAYEPRQYYDPDPKEQAGWDALKGRAANISLATYPFDAFAAPADSFDFTMLHNPATIKTDFAAAGFVLDGESDLLRMPGDDHTKHVYDPAIRGKTDRVVLRFRKPA